MSGGVWHPLDEITEPGRYLCRVAVEGLSGRMMLLVNYYGAEAGWQPVEFESGCAIREIKALVSTPGAAYESPTPLT